MKYIFLLGILPVFAACSWYKTKYTCGLEGQPLPSINLTLNDTHTRFNTDSIPIGKPFLIFLYRPDCQYCQAELGEILHDMKDFNTFRIYMIATSPYNSINQFSRHYQLYKYTNITIARDSSSSLLDYFKAPGVPYIAFYDDKKQLKRILIGKTDPDAIKDVVAK